MLWFLEYSEIERCLKGTIDEKKICLNGNYWLDCWKLSVKIKIARDPEGLVCPEGLILR